MITDTDEKILSTFQEHYNALVQTVKNRLDFEYNHYAGISYNHVLQEAVFYIYEKDDEGVVIELIKIVPIVISFTQKQIEDLTFLRSRYNTEEELDKKFTEIGEYCVDKLLKQLQKSKYNFYDVVVEEEKNETGKATRVFGEAIASDLTSCC